MKAKKEKEVKRVSLQTIIGAAKILAIKPKKGTKVVKAWAVCFALNKKCMEKFSTFPSRSEAKAYIKMLHKEIGGFEDDHHIVPTTITYTPPGTLT